VAKQVATTKQTSGAGFGFEDKVAGHFAVWLLLGGSPFVPRLGRIRKIEFQKRVDKHLLDDLVLTLDNGGHEWQCSLSVKSESQFGVATAPPSFVRAAWEMFLHKGTNQFLAGRDALGLVVAPLPDPPRTPLLRDLLPKAHRQEPQALADRLMSGDPDARSYVSENVRKLFRSFACPEPLAAKHTVDWALTAQLLRHVMVLEFDFGNDPSTDESRSVLLLQVALESGSYGAAAELWADLLGIVRRENEAGGYLDREKLLGEIRPRHQLAALPDFAADWRRLAQWGGEVLGGVVDTIGGKLRLARGDLVSQVCDQLGATRFCGIIGSSGVGKTVVARRSVQAMGTDLPVLWFASEEFSSGGFDNLASRLQLQHSLFDVLRYLPTQAGILVLDGLERVVSDEAWARIKRLLNAIRSGSQTGSWLVLFSCQSERWEFVQTRLIRSGADPHSLGVIQSPALAADDLQRIQDAFPNLYYIIYRPHVQDILQRPKVLDILATHSEAMGAANPAAWAGESDLIQWYWTSVVTAPDDGPPRAVMLQTLAERQADRGEVETPLVEIEIGSAQVLRGLERDGICQQTPSGRVMFVHDLIGDWCRQRVLLGREGTLPEYLNDRYLNPDWHRAIRLYGLHLLEGSQGITAWNDARNRLALVADLFLDSVVLAANSRALLEKLRPSLIEEGGSLLRRLLRRFLHIATYPDPVAVWLGEKSSQRIGGWLRANIRRPLWPYWLGMLSFLHAHASDVVAHAGSEAARAAEIWLQRSNSRWPLRREAAELALAVGEATWRSRIQQPYGRDEDIQKRYSAALAAAGELPDEVADLALRIAARKLTPDIESRVIGDYVAPGTPVAMHSVFGGSRECPQPEPWPDGPKYRVDEAVRHVCLFGPALASLMTVRPAVATEVILAVIIKERHPDEEEDHYPLRPPEDAAFDHLPRFSPPLYDKGPFWMFLLVAPQEAVDCILRLVNFATARWADRFALGGQPSPHFQLLLESGERSYLGDGSVCGWYRGALGPMPVASALMALEHWLYERLRQGESIDAVCRLILERAQSTASLGLLWEVGRFKPELFKGPLRPLLSCAELHEWELEALVQGINRIGMIAAYIHPEETRNKIQEWEEMEHRTVEVTRLATRLLVFEESMREFFGQVHDYWQQRQHNLPEGSRLKEYMANLIAQFDRSNWHRVKGTNGRLAEMYVPPSELQEKTKEAEQELEAIVPVKMIIGCRRILDGELSMTDDQLQAFFKTLRALVDGLPTEETGPERLAAAIVAGIAVLAEKHWDWLCATRSQLRWCRATLLEMLRHPPPVDQVFAEHDRSSLSFEDFAAQAVVPFWADKPSGKRLREVVVRCAMAMHYSAVTHLTRAAFRHRQKLGGEFDCLIAFVLRRAVIRNDIQENRYRQQEHVDVDGWFAEHGKAFINGRMASEWGNWGERAVGEGRRYPVRSRHSVGGSDKDQRRNGFAVHPRLDQHLIMSAFGGILHLGQAASDAERKKWLACWLQSLACVVGSQRVLDDAGNAVLDPDVEARDLYESDRWLADRFAMLVLEMTPEESPQVIWQTIIDLGPPGHRWIEAFFKSWLIYGLHSGKRDTCVIQWKAMFNYALDHPVWRDRQKCWPHWDGFWLHLLGIGQWTVSSWRDEDGPIVEQMKECFGQWLPQNLKDRWIARSFVFWLRTAPARPIRLLAVRWLLSVARDADNYWWDDGDLAEALAEVLGECWRDDRALILADTSLHGEFRELVAILVGRQNAIAMDLQDRMSSHGR